ncbi:aldehyde dehydrogenase (NAD+) [Nonomuraea solani]|uniref:aldehyde dehydrogenase (NAD(+)) n=1 Tax=Nonomuraea solani TaxID=1144553 RepID=A0A1H6EVC0_9ACTN|nr:aldehyde dehydrogenase family protein [Nonomuraea solani]SEH01837.1 aldehyde dehydrogenase (NAD+) [Nonomuraea solani]
MRGLYVDGAWADPHGGTLDVLDPTTEESIGAVALGDAGDVDRAVRAAARAFPGWSRTPERERLGHVREIGRLIGLHLDELTELIVADLGMPRAMARDAQVAAPAQIFTMAADLAEGFSAPSPVPGAAADTLVVREPAGVVGAITPWNFPLQEIAAKTAPALAVGCTVVVKPSEIVPMAALRLAELIDAAGLPPGVFNLVPGTGPVAGAALAAHPLVDMVSFTGSTVTGALVAEAAGRGVKKVALEMGGKSPCVLLDDAPLETAVPDTVMNAFFNSGQTCNALTRLLVPRARLPEAEKLAVAAAESNVVGDPRDAETTLGPLVSRRQLERVLGYVRRGGGRLITGDRALPERGFFAAPAVFTEVPPDAVLATEEIFGPVLCLQAYEGEDEAVALAGASPYGLSAAVWSADRERASRVARRIRAGQVHINGAGFDLGAPFGGFRQSGHGREGGRYGLEEFTQPKALLGGVVT